MSTLKLMALLGAVAVLAAGCFHIEETGNGAATSTPENGSTGRTVTGTIADLIELDEERRLQCTYEYEDEAGKRAAGVAYVDPATDRMRSDIESEVQGRTVTAHLLVANRALYVWSDQDPGGIVFPYEDGLATAEPFKSGGRYQSDFIQQEVEYECEEEDIEAQRWEVPADVAFVNFITLGTSTPGMATSTPGR